MLRGPLLILGGLGGVIVARTAALYWGQDSIALGIVALIALGLAFGLVELWRQANDLNATRVELDALPRPATADALNTVSNRLRGAVDAVRGGRPLPPRPLGFSPYLVGLLVMLGMLGTFAGLINTMAGARALMIESHDANALRAGLAAPMTGLIQAFGTSLAGIAASAVLGLAVVLLRRADRNLGRAFGAYAATHMRALTPAGLQTAALERLAEGSAALPDAAKSLAQVVDRLQTLEMQILTTHTATGERLTKTLQDATGTIKNTVSTGFKAASKATLEAVEQVAERAADKAATAAKSQLEQWTTQITADQKTRAQATSDHLESVQTALKGWTREWTAHLSEADTKRAQKDAAGLAALQAKVEELLNSLRISETARLNAMRTEFADLNTTLAQAHDVRMSADDQRAQSVFDAFGELRQAMSSAQDAQIERAHTQATDLQTQMGAVIEATRIGSQAVVAETRSGLESLKEPLAVLMTQTQTAAIELAQAEAIRADALNTRLDQVVSHVEATAERHTQGDDARLSAFHGAVEQMRTHLKQAVDHTVAQSADVADLVGRYRADLDALEARTAARLGETVDRLSTSLAEQVERFQAAQASRSAEAATVVGRLDAELQRHLGIWGAQIAGSVAEVVESAKAAPAAASRLVDAASERLAAREATDVARDQRLDAVLSRLDTSAQALTEFTATQQGRIGTVEQASEDRMVALFERIDTALGTQAERLTAFESRLESVRTTTAERLSTTLAKHAQGLGTQLDGTSAVVREAADLVRAGGAELSAVAEMFADSVDSYRESSERWLGMLAELESTLGATGREDAGRLVGDYLDQTREVFGDAMRFQRELFNELRALREGTSS